MLIQSLRKLEAYALVSRRSCPEVPPRVEYRLTPLGRSLARLVGCVGRWVEKNVVSLLRAEGHIARPAGTENRPDLSRASGSVPA